MVPKNEDRAFHFYEPRSGSGLAHSPFNAIIAPRPIGWISSVSADGARNLAPFSFFNAFNYTPPIIGFASTGQKDTLRNTSETREFCWNLVTRELAPAMNQTSAAVASGIDEFELAGLTPAPSRIVSAPHVGEARVVFECRVSQIVPLTAADNAPTVSTMVFGEVVGVHIDESFIRDGVYQTELADPVLRGGGPSAYFMLDPERRFDMARPTAD